MFISSHNATPAARPNARAMVALIAGPEPPAAAPEDLTRWRRLTPSAMWAFIGLTKVNRTTLVDNIAGLMKRRAINPRQLILLGRGDTGRRAFELVAQGALDCAGIIAIDMPCHPLSRSIGPAVAAIRLVVHHHSSRPAGERLISQLQRADFDVRVIGLGAAADRSAATARAAEIFVLELVAMTGRHCGHGV
jgi:predicted esterase